MKLQLLPYNTDVLPLTCCACHKHFLLQDDDGPLITLQRGSLLIHPGHTYLSATPGYLHTNGASGAVTLVELKSWARLPGGSLPQHAHWQVVMQLAIAAVTIAAASASAHICMP